MDNLPAGSKKYFLSLGSNIDPEKNLRAAFGLLSSCGEILSVSSVYRSEAVGPTVAHPDYLNAAVMLQSDLPPLKFQRECIAAIESRLGRIRTDDKFAPRTIDIDIMMVGGAIGSIGHRQIPSPEITTRVFVAVPLAEIAPNVLHPVEGRSLAEIALSFQGKGIEKTRISLVIV